MTSKGIANGVKRSLARINGGDMSEKPIHIKINLPNSPEGYEHGNGEGVWVIVDKDTKRDYDGNVVGGEYEGILDNDSYYWLGLEHGERLPFEMRGEYRPVVSYAWLSERYELNDDFFRG